MRLQILSGVANSLRSSELPSLLRERHSQVRLVERLRALRAAEWWARRGSAAENKR